MINFFKKKWYIVLGVIIVLAIIFILNQSTPVNKEKKPETYKIKKEILKETLSLSGEIDAEEKVTLKFQTSGRLAWVGVKEGDYVKKYQVIASLDQRDLKNRLRKHLNTFTSQRLTFDQTKDDYWNKQYDLSESIRKSAERTLQDSQYDLNNAVLDVELQSLTVEYANLWTPIEGIVTRVDTPFAGVNITPSGAEFEIVNPETIYLSVTAEQLDVVFLEKGMTGEVVFDSYPDETFSGNISYISFIPKIGETGTVYEIKLSLDEAAQKLPLKLAMTGDVSFITREKPNVLSVPLKFIKKDNKGNYVVRERKGKKEKIYVKRGEEFDSKVEVKNGVEVGDIIYD